MLLLLLGKQGGLSLAWPAMLTNMVSPCALICLSSLEAQWGRGHLLGLLAQH